LWNADAAKEVSRFLTFSGLISAVLAVDDLFLLHEELGHLFAQYLGMPDDSRASQVLESVIFFTYGLVITAILLRFHTTIWRTEFVLLAMAIVSLAASIGVDLVVPLYPEIFFSRSWGGGVANVLEELLKLTGILFWSAYFVRTGFRNVRGAMQQTGGNFRAEQGRS
jgi:hypothetical protein